jgi:hypothetical protein
MKWTWLQEVQGPNPRRWKTTRTQSEKCWILRDNELHLNQRETDVKGPHVVKGPHLNLGSNTGQRRLRAGQKWAQADWLSPLRGPVGPPLTVGGIRNQAFRIPKIKEYLQLPEFLCERPSGKTPGALESIFVFQNPSFDQYPSSPAEPPNKLRITQSVMVSVRLFGLFYDETPETNLSHPDSLGLWFAWGVSSSLTSNDFEFECDPCFRWRKVPGERGISKRLKVFSRQAHMMTTRKASRFAAWHHEAPITWRPNWRFPRNSLAHSVLIRFTRGCSWNVKSLSTSL